jgi:hypothetical protein
MGKAYYSPTAGDPQKYLAELKTMCLSDLKCSGFMLNKGSGSTAKNPEVDPLTEYGFYMTEWTDGKIADYTPPSPTDSSKTSNNLAPKA